MFLAKVYVTLKPTVNDPQGLTIKGGLHSLGFSPLTPCAPASTWRSASTPSESEAEGAVREMCSKLLANPVIEEFRVEVAPA